MLNTNGIAQNYTMSYTDGTNDYICYSNNSSVSDLHASYIVQFASGPGQVRTLVISGFQINGTLALGTSAPNNFYIGRINLFSLNNVHNICN